jgi:GNAT superfamily N-acetyltransferase
MNSTPLVPNPSTGPEYPRWSETLRDGSPVLIRPITPLDKEAERAFIEGLSAQARRFRFLGGVRSPSDAMIERFTQIDYLHEAAFAAVIGEGAAERIVGVSRYSTDAQGGSCECAVTVSDEWQDRGLGTLLMKHLIEVARAHGIRTMMSIDSAENIRMQELSRFLGFHTRVDPDDARQVIHELAL